MSSSKDVKTNSMGANKPRPTIVTSAVKAPIDEQEYDRVVDVERVKALMASAIKGKGKNGKGLAPVRTKLSYSFTQASGVNAALAGVTNIEPATSSEFATWAALYDEVYVHGGIVHFDAETTGTGAVPTGLQNSGAMSYDPVSATAQASVAGTLEASQSTLFSSGASLSGTTYNGGDGVTAVSKNGFFQFRFRVPKAKPARVSSAATNFSGEWSSTSDAADTYGFLKTYAVAQGANNTANVFGYIVLDVTFRSRQ